MQDLMIYGNAVISITDTERLIIFHQCRRLFRIQDKIWARTES